MADGLSWVGWEVAAIRRTFAVTQCAEVWEVTVLCG
jgi:hypothetical protein